MYKNIVIMFMFLASCSCKSRLKIGKHRDKDTINQMCEFNSEQKVKIHLKHTMTSNLQIQVHQVALDQIYQDS